MNDIEMIKGILRAQAWERAKGELKAVLQTSYQDGDKFEKMDSSVKNFIEYVEYNGLHE